MSTGQGNAEIGVDMGTTLHCNHEAPIVAHSLRGGGFAASEDGTGRGTPIVAQTLTTGGNGERGYNDPLNATLIPVFSDGISNTWRAQDGHQYGYAGDNLILVEKSSVRRLTPRECERLQGFPDDYTLVEYRGRLAADGPRYNALGNSMAVPVMRWIGERIQMVDGMA